MKFNRLMFSAFVLASTLFSLPAMANTPSEVADLLDARGRDGERILDERGYRVMHTSKFDGHSFAYWWNGQLNQCLRVRTSNGRFDQLKAVGNFDCNQHLRGDKDAAVAVGAAAILGLAVLAHKSHHREDREYSVDQTVQFERGFRDGLYGQPFHNYDTVSEYNFGYTRGLEQRRHETSYRTDFGYRGGSHAHVNVSDLAERETAYTWGQLERRGFKLANERKLNGGDAQWLYWNAKTNQCVEVVSSGDWVNYVGEASNVACRK